MNHTPTPPLTILITGASGLIGKALTQFLENQGHTLIKASFTHSQKNQQNTLYWNPNLPALPPTDFNNVDVIIHLAGENIVQRWTPKAQERIYNSRILSTQLISQAILQSQHRPKLFIKASAINIYQPSEQTPATEESPLVDDNHFLSKVVRDWEQASKPVEQTETRLINLRIGVVLSPQGGTLAFMLPLFKLGLGGPQGSGQQLISWIDINDLISAIHFCILNPNLQGPVNLVAPEVVTNTQFSKTLATTLHRPCWLKVPAFLLKLLLNGPAQELILKSYNISPKKLLNAGFHFKYPTLRKSLENLLHPSSDTHK